MFKSYFKIAWRNLLKNKAYTLINILGLVTGIACCLFIGLYIQHELSFDKFQPNGNRLVRVIMEYGYPNGERSKGNFTSTKVMPALARTFPEVETGARMDIATALIRTAADKEWEEKDLLYTDSTFFRMFSYKLLAGNAATALSGPGKVVLTASSAKKYFGNTNPVGQILRVGFSAVPYQITGIIEDYPSNSQIRFGLLASFSSTGEIQEETYWNANYTTYLLLKRPEDRLSLQAKIPGFMKKEMEGKSAATITYNLEPFNSIHLHSPYYGFVPTTSITYIYIIAAVALLILCIACFTYINLSTARSAERSKEVGIRKVVGAGKYQILWQFLIESVLLCMMALLISIGVVYMLLPAFNQLTGSRLSATRLFSPDLMAYAMLLVITTGLLAGSYPSFILSRFQPVKVLKGFSRVSLGSWLRPTLIVFQFTISIVLIIATFIIQKQLHFIQHARLGYDRDQIVVLPMDRKVNQSISALKNTFLASPDIRSVSASTSAPTQIGSGYSMRTPAMGEKGGMTVIAAAIDEDYLKTTGIELAAGRNFTRQEAADTNSRMYFLINETTAQALGWTPEQALNQPIYFDNDVPGHVTGVVKDFHFASLHSKVAPLVLFNENRRYTLLVKISGNNVQQTIAHLEKEWKKLVTHRPFNYHFLDEEYNSMYRSELRLGNIVNIFSGIAVLLACMGLLGLSSYAVYQRTKEIGIRKVLGASLTHITTLLSKDFLKLVLIAFLIASPIAWYAMHSWLQQYAYRIAIHWWIFALAAAGALLITLVTVSSQALRAALKSPVKTLKSE